jgi:ankyrin repeat protein
MTPRFFSAIAAAHQSLKSKLEASVAAATHPVEAVPAVGAALRHAIEAHLPEGWAIRRGYLSQDGQSSCLIEGLLIDLSAELMFQSQDLVIAPPSAVRGMVQLLPNDNSKAAMTQLAEAAEFWRSQTGDQAGPVVGLLAQPSSVAHTWLALSGQAARAQADRCVDVLVLSDDTLLCYQAAEEVWQLSQWRNKRSQSPQQPLALAYALARLMQSLPQNEGKADAWQQVDGFSLQPQASRELHALPSEAPTPIQEPKPVAVHDGPAQHTASAQATASRQSSTATPAVQTQADRQQPPLTREEQHAMHTPDQEGYYPLHRAVLNADPKRIHSLIRQGAVTEVKDKEGNTPLHLAVIASSRELAQALLTHGADPNNRNYLAAAPLHLAVEREDAALAQLVIEHGAELEARNNRGKTPLHLAATNGSVSCAAILHQHQANLEATMEKDIRPLHLAAWYGQTEVAQFLIDQGADLDAVNTDGNSPLHFAAFSGQVKLIKTLINNRANMDVTNRIGETYLQGINQGYQGEMIAVLD